MHVVVSPWVCRVGLASLLLSGLIGLGSRSPGYASPAANGIVRNTLPVGGHQAVVYSNLHLQEVHPEITRAIVAFPGNGTHAAPVSADTAQQLAKWAGEAANTVCVAAQFDPAPNGDDCLYWPANVYDGWPAGSCGVVTTAGHATATTVSTYDVADAILIRLADHQRFPHLQKLALIGHSAGGQFVQRYAGVGLAPESPTLRDRRLRFVVANPSSYMYLSNVRYVAGRGFVAADPALTACPDYDSFRYGLRRLGSLTYRHGLSAQSVQDHYLRRDVVYLLGDADRLRDSSLSTTCQAELQGSNRLERGQRFWQYLQTFYPGHHQFMTVPHVGHSESGMYLSRQGRTAVCF